MSYFGTDFKSISYLFPGLTHRHIKLKHKAEEVQNGAKITQYLRNRYVLQLHSLYCICIDFVVCGVGRVKAPVELRKKILASVATKQKLENSYYVAGASRGHTSTTTTTTADQQPVITTTTQDEKPGMRQDMDDVDEEDEDGERPSLDEILEIKPVAVMPESLELNYHKAGGSSGAQDGVERTTRVVDSTAVNLGNLKRRRKRKRVQFGDVDDEKDAAAA